MHNNLFYYIFFINIFSFLIMAYDKFQAKKKDWRVRERTIFLVALFGGALGSLVAMKFFRHKTRHIQFKIGLPILFVWNIFVFYLLKSK